MAGRHCKAGIFSKVFKLLFYSVSKERWAHLSDF